MSFIERVNPERPGPSDAEIRRRQRARNVAMLIVLLALAALFYAIALVRFKVS